MYLWPGWTLFSSLHWSEVNSERSNFLQNPYFRGSCKMNTVQNCIKIYWKRKLNSFLDNLWHQVLVPNQPHYIVLLSPHLWASSIFFRGVNSFLKVGGEQVDSNAAPSILPKYGGQLPPFIDAPVEIRCSSMQNWGKSRTRIPRKNWKKTCNDGWEKDF